MTNLSFDIDNILYEKMKKNGQKEGRSVAAEARYQFKIIYEGMK